MKGSNDGSNSKTNSTFSYTDEEYERWSSKFLLNLLKIYNDVEGPIETNTLARNKVFDRLAALDKNEQSDFKKLISDARFLAIIVVLKEEQGASSLSQQKMARVVYLNTIFNKDSVLKNSSVPERLGLKLDIKNVLPTDNANKAIESILNKSVANESRTSAAINKESAVATGIIMLVSALPTLFILPLAIIAGKFIIHWLGKTFNKPKGIEALELRPEPKFRVF